MQDASSHPRFFALTQMSPRASEAPDMRFPEPSGPPTCGNMKPSLSGTTSRMKRKKKIEFRNAPLSAHPRHAKSFQDFSTVAVARLSDPSGWQATTNGRYSPYTAISRLPKSIAMLPKTRPVATTHPRTRQLTDTQLPFEVCEETDHADSGETEPLHFDFTREINIGAVNQKYWAEVKKYENEHRAMKESHDAMEREKDAEIEALTRKNDSLRMEIGRLSSELKDANLLISRHTCPGEVRKHATDREVTELVRSLWEFVLRGNPSGRDHDYKAEIAAEVEISGKITHETLKTGLNRFGFSLTHSESLKLISSVKLDANEETVEIEKEDFITLLAVMQPYELWEDINELLSFYRVKFAYMNLEESSLQAIFTPHSDDVNKQQIVDILRQNYFAEEKRVEDIADFLLQGKAIASVSEVYERFSETIGHWKPFTAIKNRSYDSFSLMLEHDPSLAAHLRSMINVNNLIPINEFIDILERHNQKVDQDLELYIRCYNYRICGPKTVSISKMLDSVYKQDMTPHLLMAIRPSFHDSDRSGDEG